MESAEIRKKFFDYFVSHGHERVESSSLIPAQDPTLLFTNAGMNQFKDLFLGHEKREYTRAVSIQKCVRAGGKHNDLDNVGFTKRHLTFFEMMGNFSFGDYFKKEAIRFAWDFLTKVIKLDAQKLYPSVFEKDDEAYAIWHDEIKIPAQRIYRLGAQDNFWQMGDLGPCGPCTEIYVDRGPEYGHAEIQECGPGCDCDRFLEIWNVVFMQFDRQADGTLKPLKQTGVDTGMGLERLCAVMQDKDSVFLTDLLMPIISKIEKLTSRVYEQQTVELKAAFHVLADHIRSSSLLIADGCAPTNEGRGYVLRKIIRRAALFAQKLSDKNIFPELSQAVVDQLGDIYPELRSNAQLIYTILTSEIEKFSTNLTRGKIILERFFQESRDTRIISGVAAFKLYDTYGFPVEIVAAVARERDYSVDMSGFEAEMKKQQEQSGKKVTDLLSHVDLEQSTEFTGYHELETTSEIIALIQDEKLIDAVDAGKTAYVVTKKSPFFIVGGGQVPDQGWLVVDNTQVPLEEVRFINHAIGVKIKAPSRIAVGDTVTSIVDKERRTNAMKNHTGTHLLQAALIELFGKQIQQSGSLVHPDYLRFDFTYHKQLSAEDITKVEELVNEKIRDNISVTIEYMSLKEAQKKGVLAFFGEKYNPEKVRNVQIGDFSTELCGGTHVSATGAIGMFKITEVTALSAGHRRIVATTGPQALALFQETFNCVKALSQDFKVKRHEVFDTIAKQKELVKRLQDDCKKLKHQMVNMQLPVWMERTEVINNVPFLFIHLEGMELDELRVIATTLAQKRPGFYFIVSQTGEKVLFFSCVSDQYLPIVDLKQCAAWLGQQYGLKGGGSRGTVQGSGQQYNPRLEDDLKKWLEKGVGV